MNLGIIDIRGRQIRLGDRVVAYPKRFHEKKVYSFEIQDIVVERGAQKELIDTPIGIGSIIYRPLVASFKLAYDKPTANGIIETFLSDDDYHYEIINEEFV